MVANKLLYSILWLMLYMVVMAIMAELNLIPKYTSPLAAILYSGVMLFLGFIYCVILLHASRYDK